MFKKLLLTFLTLLVPFALASCEPRYFDDVKVAKIKDIYNMEAKTPVAASGILYRAAAKGTWYLTDGTSAIKVYDRDGNLDADKDLDFNFQKVLVKGTVDEFVGRKQIKAQEAKLNEKSSVKLPETADISQLKLFASIAKGKEKATEEFAKLDGKIVKFDAKLVGFKETYGNKKADVIENDTKIKAGKTPDYIELQLEVNGDKTNVRIDVRELKWMKWFKKNIDTVKALYKDIEIKKENIKENKAKTNTYIEYKLPEAKLVSIDNAIASFFEAFKKDKKGKFVLTGPSFAQFDITTKFTITFK